MNELWEEIEAYFLVESKNRYEVCHIPRLGKKYNALDNSKPPKDELRSVLPMPEPDQLSGNIDISSEEGWTYRDAPRVRVIEEVEENTPGLVSRVRVAIAGAAIRVAIDFGPINHACLSLGVGIDECLHEVYVEARQDMDYTSGEQ